MKKIFAVFLLLFIFNPKAYTQCEYADFSDAPEELFRKRVNEPSMRYGNPYTMFVKGDNFNLEATLDLIRINIRNDINYNVQNPFIGYAKLYKSIWDNAISNEPLKCAYNEECNHPVWVKSNAIIYIVGLRYDTTSLGKDTFKLMTPAGCDTFFNRAHEGLRNLNPEVISCWGGSDCGKVHFKAGQLVQYLQAYDLLKAKGGIPQYDGDRNGGSCTARNKLRQFARNLYKQSDDIINSSLGWKKNHGIICASALGMAAIVLNDAGVETDFFNTWYSYIPIWGMIARAIIEPLPHPTYSPLKWYDRAPATRHVSAAHVE